MTCPTCKKEYDETKKIHVPIMVEETRGTMVMRTSSGTCKELEKQ